MPRVQGMGNDDGFTVHALMSTRRGVARTFAFVPPNARRVRWRAIRCSKRSDLRD